MRCSTTLTNSGWGGGVVFTKAQTKPCRHCFPPCTCNLSGHSVTAERIKAMVQQSIINWQWHCVLIIQFLCMRYCLFALNIYIFKFLLTVIPLSALSARVIFWSRACGIENSQNRQGSNSTGRVVNLWIHPSWSSCSKPWPPNQGWHHTYKLVGLSVFKS